MSKLERIRLEFNTARTNVKEESEIDMRDSAFSVNHDVAVMPILNLKDIAEDTVGCHRLYEVVSSSLEGDTFSRTELEKEELGQIVDLGAAHFIARRRIWNDINDTSLNGYGS